MAEARPDLITYLRVDGAGHLGACEADPDGARKVNVDGTLAVARQLTDAGAFPVLVSTNAVFDGTEPHVPADTPPNPANVYGALKAEAEAGVTLSLMSLGPSAQPA